MDRRDFYFKQAVAEDELDGAFDAVENALFNMPLDWGVQGIFSGLAASQIAPTPNLTIDVSDGVAMDQAGERMAPAGNPNVVNCAQDSQTIPTTVTGVGNERYVSVFLKFARALSDPRTDGNNVTVYFKRNESFEFVVVQGAEASVGTATKPAKDPTMLLVCDVHLIHGQTQIQNSDITTTRRDDAFVIADTPLSIRAGTISGAITAMLSNLNGHILGSMGEHPATAITTSATGAWADASTVASGTVQSSINGIVSALAAAAGTAKIGGAAHAGTRYSLAAASADAQHASLQAEIDSILTNGIDQIAVVSSVANLRAIVSSTIVGLFRFVIGALNPQGLYYYDSASTATDDGFSTIKPNDLGGGAPGRWRIATMGGMLFDQQSGGISSAGYGSVISSGTGTSFADVAGAGVSLLTMQNADRVCITFDAVVEAANGETISVIVATSEAGGGYVTEQFSEAQFTGTTAVPRGKISGYVRHDVSTAGAFAYKLQYKSLGGALVKVEMPTTFRANVYRN